MNCLLDDLSEMNWDMEPVDRSLKILESDDPLIKLIIDNTRYINFETFKREILKQVEKLPEKINIYFNLKNFGSENWITVLVWKQIRHKCVQIITSLEDMIQNEYPIVIIDDCIYSGIHMCNIVDDMTYYKREVKLTNKFICVVAYKSRDGDDRLIQDFGDVEVFCDNIVEPIFKDYDLNFLNRRLGVESLDVIPLYFDHKIANNFGSFPEIYKDIVKEKPSRHKIEELMSKINLNIC